MNIMQLKSFVEQHNPWRARVYSQVAQALTQSAFTVITMGTVDFDPSGMVTTGVGGGITIPVDGIYHVGFSGAIAALPDTGRIVVALFKNTAEFKRGHDWLMGGAVPATGSGNVITYLKAGDLLDVRVFTSTVSMSSVAASPYLYLSVAYLSAA